MSSSWSWFSCFRASVMLPTWTWETTSDQIPCQLFNRRIAAL